MINEHGASVITVRKSELLGTLRKNLETHRATFLKAQEGFRKVVIANLEEMLADAREGRRIRKAIQLVDPIDQSRDYERVIRMLEMCVNEEVTISEGEFSQYVMDDWSWKHQFVTTAQSYSR